jgi:xylulokinase
MHGLVTLDAAQQPLRPAILWNDQRTAEECAEIEERVGLARLIELTGNRAITGFTAPKLLWLRTHEPEVYARIAHILLPKDYVRLRLEGELAIDAADASGTLLFDVANRSWSDEVLAAFDIPREWLPPSYESTEIAGAGDQAAGALGVGIDEPGPLSVVLGTSGVVFGVLPGYSADPEARLHTFCHAVPGTWHAMGVMLAAAGLTSRHDRGALTRAVLEGVAYGLRDSLELLKELGFAASVGRVSGGGARSELWTEIVATVLGLPLERTAVDEGAAYGAALLAGVRSGRFADAHEAVAECVRVTGRVEPNASWTNTYDEGYERFRALYPALRALT